MEPDSACSSRSRSAATDLPLPFRRRQRASISWPAGCRQPQQPAESLQPVARRPGPATRRVFSHERMISAPRVPASSLVDIPTTATSGAWAYLPAHVSCRVEQRAAPTSELMRRSQPDREFRDYNQDGAGMTFSQAGDLVTTSRGYLPAYPPVQEAGKPPVTRVARPETNSESSSLMRWCATMVEIGLALHHCARRDRSSLSSRDIGIWLGSGPEDRAGYLLHQAACRQPSATSLGPIATSLQIPFVAAAFAGACPLFLPVAASRPFAGIYLLSVCSIAWFHV